MASSGYTAITFIANEQPTTAKWNLIGSNDSSFNLGTGLEDGVIISRHISGIDKSLLSTEDKNPYKFSAYCSTGKNVFSTTLIVDLQTELFDTNNNFSSSRYTAPVSGFYFIEAQAWWGSAGAGTNEYATIHIRKNGSASNMPESGRISGSGTASTLIRPVLANLIQLTAGDYIELWISTSGSRDLVAGLASTPA
jgi:hypothetical protein